MTAKVRKKSATKLPVDRITRAKKNWSEIERRLRPFSERKNIERISTAGRWKDASELVVESRTEIHSHHDEND